MADAPTDCPVSDVDPFSDGFLADPFPPLAHLRELGEVCYLRKYHVWGVARHDQVRAVLADHTTFSSGYGVGYTHLARERPWRTPSLILEADPPLHTRTRGVLSRLLAPRALREMKETFTREATALAERLVARGRFDAVKDLGEAYPLKVFPDAVGLPAEGRENLLVYGGMTFNGHGPRNHLFEAAMSGADDVREWITGRCARSALAPGGLGSRIYDAVDAGELTEEEAALLVRSFLSAGVDTTVGALGFAVRRFAEHPDQWDLLRADPSLARSAFEEVVRIESPVIGFFRTAVADTEVGGARIPRGAKMLVFFSGAARDPRRWQDPDGFDIRRRAVGHTGFGSGIHGCVGQMVARLEGEAVLGALASRVARWHLDGEPEVRLNNTLRGLARLPVRVEPATAPAPSVPAPAMEV
ncbi:cytochrome P450 [Streptomyces sp. NPDC050560]|uniref:cytochrome P450 n=1 Tax=Streptomyces sp. NPDC050560 TaxID=3365630 RepID=UPI0037B4136B